MRWDTSHESPDVIDRRGERSGGGFAGNAGILYLILFLIRRPWGWAVLLLLGIGYFVFGLGRSSDEGRPLHGGDTQQGTATPDSPDVHFVSFVIDDVQDAWARTFQARGLRYRRAKLVLYTDATTTACGEGQAATGPFYCPVDERIYLDLGFFRELSGRLGARGRFAEAYVIAHEVGHHVQKQLGVTSGAIANARGPSGGSVRLELQADCYAGIWAHSTGQRDLLESGDIESAISAAGAVGDDRLQRMATGTVRPESWTHGSSDERQRWFSRGYEDGSLERCDTFHERAL